MEYGLGMVLSGGAPYGAVISLDGRGTVTFHLPTHGTAAAELSGRGAVPLPRSYELDDALSPIGSRYLGDAEAVDKAMQAVANQGKSK